MKGSEKSRQSLLDEPNMKFDNKKEYDNFPAIVFHDKRINYNEFLKKCAIFAFILTKLQVGDEKVVIIINKSTELIICMYACFLYGYTFVPIDPSYPQERTHKIIEETDPAVVVVDRDNRKKINHRVCILMPDMLNCINDSDLLQLKIREIQEVVVQPDMISTIYFTSGSTGKPKGVVIYKEGQMNHILGLSKYINFDSLHQTLTLTSISFDLFFDQCIMPLYYSVGLVVADEIQQKDPKSLVELLLKNQIDVLSVTPSRLQLISSFDNDLNCLKNMRYIMFGGEKCPTGLLYRLQNACEAILYNMYGPTEASVYAAISDLSKKREIDIGKPLPNYEIFILNDKRNKLDINERGEIAISGIGLAKEYFNEEKLTNSRFVHVSDLGNKRVYLSGDIGFMNEDGNLCCLGRIDNQLKIKGFRVEPEEIEAVINLFQGIDKSLVKTITLTDNSKLLATWYVGEIVDIEKLKSFLKEKLPNYMIPCRYYRISKFKYTITGKLDRKEKYSMEELTSITSTPSLLNDRSFVYDKVIASIIDHVAEECKDLTKNLILASIGIDSIKFIKIIVDLEEQLEIEFDPEFLVFDDNETIEQFCVRIEDYLVISSGGQKENSTQH